VRIEGIKDLSFDLPGYRAQGNTTIKQTIFSTSKIYKKVKKNKKGKFEKERNIFSPPSRNWQSGHQPDRLLQNPHQQPISKFQGSISDKGGIG
jgi:hypothetical protein